MITELSIKNFKSIKNATLKLKGLNLLIGANNAGKSNVLDALLFYQRFLNANDISEPFGPGPYSFRSAFHRGSDIRTESLAMRVKSIDKEEVTHSFDIDDYYNKTGSGPRFLLQIKDEMIVSPEREESASNQTSSLFIQKWRDRKLYEEPCLSEFFQACRNIRSYQFIPTAIKREQLIDPLGTGVPFLLPDGRNTGNVLFALRDNNSEIFRKIMDDFKAIFPEVSGLSFRHLGESKYALEFSKEVHGQIWNFLSPETSDGFALTLAILTLLHVPNSPKIILIEEIENGLNPSTLRFILESLMSASANKGTQFLITTHSPALLDLMSDNPESIIICEQEQGHSTYTPLSSVLEKFGSDYEPGESLIQLWLNGLIGGL